jgi:predicted nucleotidyltransferase
MPAQLKPEMTALLTERLRIAPIALTEFCQRWQISEFALFGSVLRDDFRSDSDVDVLVSFSPEADSRWNLFDLIKMQQELEQLFSRSVDLTEKAGLENPYRRAEILKTYQVVYANP